MTHSIYTGDVLEALKKLPDNSVDPEYVTIANSRIAAHHSKETQ